MVKISSKTALDAWKNLLTKSERCDALESIGKNCKGKHSKQVIVKASKKFLKSISFH